MRVFRPLALAAALLFIVVGAKAGVITYDLTTAEDANSANVNPDGVWSFLGGSTVLPYMSDPACFAGGGLAGFPPSVYDLGTGTCSAAFGVANGTGPSNNPYYSPSQPIWVAGDVFVYSADDNISQATVDWTAPAAGSITISGDIWSVDDVPGYAYGPRSNDYVLSIDTDGTPLATGTVTDVGGSSPASPITFSGGGTTSVNAGDVVSLEIRQSAGQTYGSLDGIDLSVTETTGSSSPEPSTMLLLASALGALTLRCRVSTAR